MFYVLDYFIIICKVNRIRLLQKIAHVLKLCLPTPVIEAMLSNKIEYIRLKRSLMVKKLVIKLEIKTCVPFLSVLYCNIESREKIRN